MTYELYSKNEFYLLINRTQVYDLEKNKNKTDFIDVDSID